MKLLSLFSAKAARRDLSEALELTPHQRAALEADPDKLIDEIFGDDCSGGTRAMLGGGPSTWVAFKSVTSPEIGVLAVTILFVLGFIVFVATHL